MRPLLVGESNPYNRDPFYALYPAPAQSAGARLMSMLCMTREEYMRSFDRVNLFVSPPPKWSLPVARDAATILEDKHCNEIVFLLGRKVAAAYGFKNADYWRHYTRVVRGQLRVYTVIPHPSGRCREWSKPSSVQKLNKIVDWYLKETKVR